LAPHRAVAGDGSGRSVLTGSTDSAPGDVRNAVVTFKEGGTTLCSAPVGLLDGATTAGSASCSAPLSLGSHTITVVVGNYYAGGTSALVEVASPDGSFITGGGYLRPARSAGTYPANPGSETDFAFNVKYGKNLKSLSGHATVHLRSGGRTYEIRSTALESLGLSSTGGIGRADLRSKANLLDITDPANPTSVAGG
jgi:hypothetical protein